MLAWFLSDSSLPIVFHFSGMDWVARNGIRPAVASMSLGGGGTRAVDESLRNLHKDGVTVVVAAMNEYTDSCAFSPARAPEVFAISFNIILNTAYSFKPYIFLLPSFSVNISRQVFFFNCEVGILFLVR